MIQGQLSKGSQRGKAAKGGVVPTLRCCCAVDGQAFRRLERARKAAAPELCGVVGTSHEAEGGRAQIGAQGGPVADMLGRGARKADSLVAGAAESGLAFAVARVPERVGEHYGRTSDVDQTATDLPDGSVSTTSGPSAGTTPREGGG